MTTAKKGDTVHLHYTCTLADGTQFDSSAGREPLAFTVGSGQIIKGLDAAIPGMAVGDKKVVEIPSDLAYGARNPVAQQTVLREHLPAEIPLEVGMVLQMNLPDGQTMAVTVTDMSDDEVTLDANHRLAGKDLTFAIELVAIDPA
jgi:peptidylprolyl isomerase